MMAPNSDCDSAFRCDGPGQIGERKIISFVQFATGIDCWVKLESAPLKDWKPWCFRGLVMCPDLVGDEEAECKDCPWLTDCKKSKERGQ